MRVIELRDDRHGLEAFVVVDHDQFPIAAGGTRMLPDVDVSAVDLLIGVAVVVVANTAISSALVRRGDRPHGAVAQFVLTLAINVGIVLVGQLVVSGLRGTQLENALVFVLLLSLIVTCYDRYRPLYKARFANGPLPMPRGAGDGQATGAAGAG